MSSDIVNIPDHTERDNEAGVLWIKAAPTDYFDTIPRAYNLSISADITFKAGNSWHDINGIFDTMTFSQNYKQEDEGDEYSWRIRLENGKKSLAFDQTIHKLKRRELIILLMLINKQDYPLLVGDFDNWMLYEEDFDSNALGNGGNRYNHSIRGKSRIPAYHYLGSY